MVRSNELYTGENVGSSDIDEAEMGFESDLHQFIGGCAELGFDPRFETFDEFADDGAFGREMHG